MTTSQFFAHTSIFTKLPFESLLASSNPVKLVLKETGAIVAVQSDIL